MRILYVSQGLTVHDERFLRTFVSWDATVVCVPVAGVSGSGNVLDSVVLEVPPVPCDPENLETVLRVVPHLQRVLREHDLDVVIAGPLHTAGFAATIAGATPCVCMSFASDIYWDAKRNPLAAFAVDYALNHCHGLACDCRAVLDVCLAHRTAPSIKTALFPYGIDPGIFTPGDSSLRADLGFAQDDFVILGLRGFSDIHAPQVIVKAFAAAQSKLPQLRLLLVGAGLLREDVQQLVAMPHIADKVRLLSPQPHDSLPALYRAVDLYVSASLSDGTSISLLEAMASGLPVIVPRLGGNPEWIGQGGMLTEPGDDASLAQALESIGRMPRQQRRSMGAHNRAVVEARGNWARESEKLRTMLEYIATRKGEHAG